MTEHTTHDDIVIVAAARTPQGRLKGQLGSFTAPQLGGFAIAGALEKAGIPADAVDAVILGQVLPAGSGQNPARQAALAAGLGWDVPASAVNKVCLSGLTAIIDTKRMIVSGDATVVVAGRSVRRWWSGRGAHPQPLTRRAMGRGRRRGGRRRRPARRDRPRRLRAAGRVRAPASSTTSSRSDAWRAGASVRWSLHECGGSHVLPGDVRELRQDDLGGLRRACRQRPRGRRGRRPLHLPALTIRGLRLSGADASRGVSARRRGPASRSGSAFPAMPVARRRPIRSRGRA